MRVFEAQKQHNEEAKMPMALVTTGSQLSGETTLSRSACARPSACEIQKLPEVSCETR